MFTNYRTLRAENLAFRVRAALAISLLLIPAGSWAFAYGQGRMKIEGNSGLLASPLSPNFGIYDPLANDSPIVLHLYVWGAGLSGNAGVNGNNAPIDISLGDVLSDVEPALSLHFELWQNRRYGFWIDGSYLSLSGKAQPVNEYDVTLDFESVTTELVGSYRNNFSRTSLEIFAGLRYNNLRARYVAVPQPGSGNVLPVSESGRQDWLDPLLGSRVLWQMARKLPVVLRGDLGGFGLGSDFTWGVTAGLGYELSRAVVITGAYRLLDIDYKKGDRQNEFVYNAQQSGALLGVAFRW